MLDKVSLAVFKAYKYKNTKGDNMSLRSILG